ncbi:MAG: SMC-Scp complex subunit ScpB [Candidatus Bathyarchaeota archaeon]|nr:SMC-Scp complex subunit ScpB [Candidatus Bathyarchaeota archaeon]
MPPESAQKAEPASDRLKRALRLIEAALYVAGRPLDLSEICSVLKTRSREKAKKLVKMLMQEYASRDAALEILEVKGERYVMQLKAELTPYIRRIVKRPLLSTGPLKTLSYIALRQPVSQKRVIEVRGRHAYRHISLLKEMGLITSERRGRATVLRTTDYFADYFGLSHDISVMKRELRKTLGEQFADEKNQQQT